MREFHVIFMYYALPLLWRFPEHVTDAHDLVEAEDEEELIHELPTGGEALMTAMKALLRGLHLTKGFTSEVTKLPQYFRYYLYKIFNFFKLEIIPFKIQ
jgi:hypothetical protein